MNNTNGCCEKCSGGAYPCKNPFCWGCHGLQNQNAASQEIYLHNASDANNKTTSKWKDNCDWCKRPCLTTPPQQNNNWEEELVNDFAKDAKFLVEEDGRPHKLRNLFRDFALVISTHQKTTTKERLKGMIEGMKHEFKDGESYDHFLQGANSALQDLQTQIENSDI